MAAAAAIKFTQGALVGTAGVALKGVSGASVTVTNGVNTSVASWKIEVLDVPGGSAVATGTLGSNNNSNTPSASFTPDVAGSFRIRSSVWSVINQVGAPDDIDIRVFAVAEPNGLVAPPYQGGPAALTPISAGGTHPDECNFSGTSSTDGRGWAGNGSSDGLLEQAIAVIDKVNATSVGGKFLGGASKTFDYPRSVVAFRGMRIYGHSFSDLVQGTSGFTTISSSDFLWQNVLAGALGLPKERVVNQGIVGSEMTKDNASSGWAQGLVGINGAKPVQDAPFMRSGECLFIVSGINDLGNNTSANQTKLVSDFGRALKALISLHRASAIYPCQTSAQWAFGANFSNAGTAQLDYTMGTAKQATVVDSSGSSTATFTIPAGYQGETICFSMVALTGGSLIVTWGGTVVGTTSIIGRTDTLSGLTVNAHGAYTVRFTAATNGLTSANAGQTITVRITTVSGSTFWIDAAWLEAKKPAPVIVANVPKCAQEQLTIACGDGVANGTTTFTSAKAAQFVSASDAGVAIVETDAGGHIPGGTTISSVTNATTVVLSASASSASSIQFTIARKVLGYSSNYTTNTNFSGATTASHSAADTNVTNLNTEITSRVAEFGSMVKIADFDAALGSGDTVKPSGVLSWFELDGLHPNNLGHERLAKAALDAIYALAPEDTNDVGAVEIAGSASRYHGPTLLPINSGQIYLPPFTSWNGTSYTAVAGDMFALPLFITQGSAHLGQWIVEQTNAPATSGSNIRVGVYNDFNFSGYPQTLWFEPTSGGTFALGTTSGVKSPTQQTFREPKYGVYWLVLKIDSLGTTASQLRQITGPSPLMPQWRAAGGGTSPVAWKLTGQAAGVLPNVFPTGASLVDSAPAFGVPLTVF